MRIWRAKEENMDPTQFRHWRKSLGLKQAAAGNLLGLKRRMIQYYEKGDRNGKAVAIPKYIRLACFAITQGVQDFDGEVPTKDEAKPARKHL